MKRTSLILLVAAACVLPGCYSKTVRRSPGFGEPTGTVHEPDAPDNALEDVADVLYPRDWKRKKEE